MFPSHGVVMPTLDYGRCQACRKCDAAQHCRFKAFVRIDREEPPFIDVGRCGGCGECVLHCPYDALSVPKVSR
jgi:MinD superfamily P-loop ATPase